MSRVNKNLMRFWLMVAMLASIVVLLDFAVKTYMLRFSIGETIWSSGLLHLTLQKNKGVAFSIPLEGAMLIIILLVVVAILAWFVYKHFCFDSAWSLVLLGLLTGGAVGNLIDRLRFGEVTDFIGVGDFPLFNLADSAITISGIILVFFWPKIIKR